MSMGAAASNILAHFALGTTIAFGRQEQQTMDHEQENHWLNGSGKTLKNVATMTVGGGLDARGLTDTEACLQAGGMRQKRHPIVLLGSLQMVRSLLGWWFGILATLGHVAIRCTYPSGRDRTMCKICGIVKRASQKETQGSRKARYEKSGNQICLVLCLRGNTA